jgi:hypothetical protein
MREGPVTANREEIPSSKRLVNGAAMLGRLWKRQNRCKRGWDVTEADVLLEGCGCEPRTDFCKVRGQWIRMAGENGQDIVIGENGLARSMNDDQWDATGLTITLRREDGQEVKVGPKGSMSMRHYMEIESDPASAAAIFALVKAFPKARVEGILAAGVGFPVNERGEFV